MTEWLFEAIRNLPPEWKVIILSAAPVSEVRGGIPAGLALGMPLATILPLAVISNVISVLPVVLGFNWIADRLAKKPVLGGLISRLIRRARSKEAMVKKYGILAIVLFVAVPLPVTGAWTGSLVAAVFGMRFWQVVLCLTLGVLIAAAIVTSLSLAGIHILESLTVAD